MRKLVYDVALTLDGFIAHEDGSIGGFAMEGAHADAYMERLQGYDTVVMGRKTYEAGYAFGLKPGQRAYPHMDHYIVSKTLELGDDAEVTVVRGDFVDAVKKLKQADGGDIYLCGGGMLAGVLLDHGLIDQLLIKLNPVIIGSGISLFGARAGQVAATLIDTETYENGVVLLRYSLGNLSRVATGVQAMPA
ncbi:MAG: dihydrofolate reductase family protein [Haliangiales bacterium]